MTSVLSRLLLMFLFVGSVFAADDGRYPTPEQSPVFGKPRFISVPVDRAYPGVEYNIRPAVIGGTWPYRFTLTASPEGMTIDPRKGTISWKAPASEGQVSVSIALKDKKDRTASQSFTITVSKKGFVFVSPSGDDANPGTFEKPWKTVMRAAQPVEDSANTTLYLRGGEYRVDVPAKKQGAKNINVLRIMRTSPRRWVAWPGEKPVIDLGWSREKWRAALDAQLAKADEKRKRYVNTQKYGHRIYLGPGINGMLFDGLEVKNAAYYMFVMWNGNRKNLTWRRCHLHHLYGDYAENPSFIFTFASSRKYAKPAKGERFAFGQRPKAKPYKHMVVQDCLISDRPYWNFRPSGWHGGGLIWYTTQECLVEDSRFERIERGQTILDKDNGWDNTYRNNVLLGNFMVAAQGCNDGVNIHHNFITGGVSLGQQPGWARNIWFHHNAVRGSVSMLGGATQGPVDELLVNGQPLQEDSLNGYSDPNAEALVRNTPVERRLVFAWGNAIDLPLSKRGRRQYTLVGRISDKGIGFAKKTSYTWWGGNLMDDEGTYAIGWGGKTIKWLDYVKAYGFESERDTGKVVFDKDGYLPEDSPWRAKYGRQVGTELP